MNILLFDNPYLRDELLEDGHHVITCGRGDGRFDITFNDLHPDLKQLLGKLSDSDYPDLLLFMERGAKHLYRGLEGIEIPKAYYAIDSHLFFDFQRDYAFLFDFIFVAHRDYVRRFKDYGIKRAFWLPLGCDPDKDKFLCLEEDIDLCFVGKLDSRLFPRRTEFINRLRERLDGRYRIEITSGPYVELYNRSRIILNHCVNDDLNFRVFEAMACGGMLLTQRTGNGLLDLFEDRRHLVLYEKDDVDMVVELVEYYVSHEEERRQICLQGREEVLSHHTLKHRAKMMIGILEENDYTTVSKIEPVDKGLKYLSHAKVFISLAYPQVKHLERERLDIAKGLLERRISLCQEDRNTCLLLGIVCFLQGRLKEAREWIGRSIKHAGENVMPLLALGALSYYEGDFKSSSLYWGSVLSSQLGEKMPSKEDRDIQGFMCELFKDFLDGLEGEIEGNGKSI